MDKQHPMKPRKQRQRNPKARDRVRRLLVGVNLEERLELQRLADIAMSSLSAFIRNAALTRPVVSVFNHEVVRELAAVNAEMGRIGDLVKDWLSHPLETDVPAPDLSSLLRELGQLQLRARALLDEVASQ